MNKIFLDLKQSIDELLNQKSQKSIIAKLQIIMKIILSNYAFKINGKYKTIIIYPIEIEAYYFNEPYFEDNCVHRNEKQKNNFGRLYLHKTKNNYLKGGTRKGMDICLSNNNYILAFLIRSAYINENRICGPCLLVDKIFQELEFNYKKDYEKLESQEVLMKIKKTKANFYKGIRINVNSKMKNEYLRIVRIENNYFTGLKNIKNLKTNPFN